MTFKMHKIIFFPEKKIIKKKYVYLPYLKFLDPLPQTHIFYFFGLINVHSDKFSEERGINGQSLHLHPYFLYASRDWDIKLCSCMACLKSSKVA